MQHRRKILLVDDDPSLLTVLGDFLETEGYAVLKAESGEAALAVLRTQPPDLIVLDMMMPGIGGMGVLDRIVQPDGSLRFPVLVLTARAQMADYFADKQVDGFLSKPCEPEALSEEIARILFQNAGIKGAVTIKRCVYVGESLSGRSSKVARALEAEGFETKEFVTGEDLLEAAILAPPAGVVMNLDVRDQGAAAVQQMLSRIESTRNVPIVVYAVGELPGGRAAIAKLDTTKCHFIETMTAEPIAKALGALVV